MSGTLVYARSQRIDYKSGALFLVATLPGGILGALLVNHIPRGPFQLFLGGLLCAVAIYLMTKPGNLMAKRRPLVSGNQCRIVDAMGRVFEYRVHRPLGTIITFFFGILASMLGVGGGIFNVPAFVLILGIPIEIATATSHFMVMGTALIANLTNLAEGDLNGLWVQSLSLATGTMVGGQVGPRISYRYGSTWLTMALSSGLLLVGVRLFWAGWVSR
jgi:uncharacterized protein